MNFMSLRAALALAVLTGALAAAEPRPSPAGPPAKVTGAVKETELATVVLSAKAELRLGVKTVAVERRPMPASRMFGGETLVPRGREVTVSAPVAGTLGAALNRSPGDKLARGEVMFALVPILTPVERANVATAHTDAAVQIATAKVVAEAARVTLARAERLVKSEAGSQRAVDDARAAVAVADANVKAAESRAAQLAAVLKDFTAGNVGAIAIEAPFDGVLTQLRVRQGQAVAGGAPLFELARLDTLWLRVAVFGGEAALLRPDSPARVTALGAKPGDAGIVARPVAAPPTANAAAATVDLYFELPNAGGLFRPGERLAVTLSLRTEESSLTVPFNAVLHDIHGGQWVYENTAPQTFVRRRVQVSRVAGTDAVLASGPPAGTKVVTDGAAEIFGTELGPGK